MVIEMRDKLKAAIDGADRHSLGFLDRATDAVLDALMEPDEGMVRAGRFALEEKTSFSPEHGVRQCYTAMLTAARSGRSGER